MAKQSGERDDSEPVITREMIEAGASVLWDLAGEASKEFQAEAVFRAMLAACPKLSLEEGNTEATA